MFWQQENNKLKRSAAITAAVSLVLGGAVSAAGFAPGTPSIGDLVGGGLFGSSSGGTFYDFESVFADGAGGSDGFLGLSGILNDLFGGADGLGIIEDIIGGGDGLVSDCGIIIMNFSGSCSADSMGNILFDTVIGEVSSELGLPDEIAGVLTGRQSIEGIFADLLNEELGKLGIPTGSESEVLEAGTVVGKQGLPSPNGLLDKLLAASAKPSFTPTPGGSLPAQRKVSGTPALNVMTPGVNTSLVKPMLALKMLTSAATDRGLSPKGQDVTSARNMAAQASARTSGIIGKKSVESAEKQLEAAAEMNDTVREQTSTQDALKEALTGMNMLQAESTQLQAQANSQQAISTQVDGMSLQVAQEMRDGVFTNGISLKTLNEQALADSQKEMALNHSIRSEQAVPIRMLGAFR